MGQLQVTAEETGDANFVARFKFSGTKLDKKDGPFGKSDPYVSSLFDWP